MPPNPSLGERVTSADPAVPAPGLPQHLVERLGRIEAGLPGKAEDPLDDPVALHLVRPGGDRDDASVEVVEGGAARLVVPLRPCERFTTAYFERQARPHR